MTLPIWNQTRCDPRNLIGRRVIADRRRNKYVVCTRVGRNTTDFFKLVVAMDSDISTQLSLYGINRMLEERSSL